MKKLLISTALILLSAISIFGQTCEWAVGIGGNKTNYMTFITCDNFGNNYIGIQSKSDSLTFNNGQSFTNIGGYDAFLAKYNSLGKCLWVEKIAGNNYEVIYGISLDSNNNIFVAGYYNSSLLTFNNGKSIINSGNIDSFLAKYNCDGKCDWAENISGVGNEEVRSIAIDRNNNVYLSGHYSSDTLKFNNEKFLKNSSNYFDCFIAKYNETGTCQWVENIGGSLDEIFSCITVDLSGNLYITGNFLSEIIYCNNRKSTGKSTGSGRDIFIAKYNMYGSCMWLKQISGNRSQEVYCITIDKNNNLYVGGRFNSSILYFNNGVTLSNNTSYDDGFLAKYSNWGNCQWAEKTTGNNNNSFHSISTDLNGNIYISGHYSSPIISFNNNQTLKNMGNFDSFITKNNISGICQWAENVGGSSYDYIRSTFVDVNGNVIIIGDFESDTLFLNNGKSVINDQHKGFIAKYSQNGTSVTNETIQNNISVYPNPAGDYIDINGSIGACSNDNWASPIASEYIQIFDMLGVLVAQTSSSVNYQTERPNSQTGASDPQRIDVSYLFPGMYFIKIGNKVEKFVKI